MMLHELWIWLDIELSEECCRVQPKQLVEEQLLGTLGIFLVYMLVCKNIVSTLVGMTSRY